MNENKWILVKQWKRKPQGQVWIVKNQHGQKGYFKFTTHKQWYYSGPMVANELISAKLAKLIGLPIAKIEIASVRGLDGLLRRGIVSLEEPAQEVVTWREVGNNVQNNPELYVNNIKTLSQMIVFDAWICNIDRAQGKNLILFRHKPDSKFDWYLIDHGHTLHGAPRKWKRAPWNSLYWYQLWKFCHTPRGLLKSQSSFKNLEAMIRRIESIPRKKIRQICAEIPFRFLKTRERNFITRLLLTRQKRLRKIIKDWLRYKGQKEYGEQ